jgi:hypothetical protein
VRVQVAGKPSIRDTPLQIKNRDYFKTTDAAHLFTPKGSSLNKTGDASGAKINTATGSAISQKICFRFARTVPIMPANWWRTRSALGSWRKQY